MQSYLDRGSANRAMHSIASCFLLRRFLYDTLSFGLPCDSASPLVIKGSCWCAIDSETSKWELEAIFVCFTGERSNKRFRAQECIQDERESPSHRRTRLSHHISQIEALGDDEYLPRFPIATHQCFCNRWRFRYRKDAMACLCFLVIWRCKN